MITNPIPSHQSASLIYDASSTNADLLYLTGFYSEDPFLWLSFAGHDYLIVSELELGRARRLVPAEIEVLTYNQARQNWGGNNETRKTEDYIEIFSRYTNNYHWRVTPDFPLGLALSLNEKNVQVEPVELLCPSLNRKRKTKDEIEKLRNAVRLAEQALEKGIDIISQADIDSQGYLQWNGAELTAERLRGEINVEILRGGGLPSRTITAPGKQAADPHEVGFGPIAAGQPVVLDIFPRVESTGYHGDLTRTVVKGKAPEIVTQAYEAVMEAKKTGLQSLKPGIPASLPHQKAAAILEAHGFTTGRDKQNRPCGFFHGLGHGIGLEIHEDPRLTPKTNYILETGNVVTVEPGLYYPEWGGVRLEDVAVITETGFENLTSVPMILEIS